MDIRKLYKLLCNANLVNWQLYERKRVNLKEEDKKQEIDLKEFFSKKPNKK